LRADRDGLEAGPVARRPLLSPGPLGAFDDSGVTGGCLVAHDDRLYLYYSGWSLGRTVPFYFYVGLAVSDDDGATFDRISPAPILERAAVDPYLTASPSVLVEDGLWRMWYVSGTGWDGPRHRYHVRYAESDDGIQWRRDGHVCIDFNGPDEYAFSRPWVVRDGDRYRMWYSVRGDTYRLGYAESLDGHRWERLDGSAGLDPSAEGWDAEMIAYPAILDADGQRFLLYNGAGYGRSGIGYAMLGDQA
jgi:hypothetical protein